MPRLSPVNAIVTSTDVGGGKAIVELQAAKSVMTLQLAEDSAWLRYLTEGAVVSYTIDVTQLGTPAPDQITTTALTQPAAGNPNGSIVPVETFDGIELPNTFVTPAGDVPAPTLTPEKPAVVTSSAMANKPIADVKEALGIA